MNIGRTVILEGVTNLGKNRIKEHGDTWKVVDCKPGLNCLFMAPDGYLKWGLVSGDNILPDFRMAEDQLRHVE